MWVGVTSLHPITIQRWNRCHFPHCEVPVWAALNCPPFPITIFLTSFSQHFPRRFFRSQDSSGSNGPMLRGGEDTCVVLHATMEMAIVLYLLVIRLVVKLSYAGKSAGILGILCAKKTVRINLAVPHTWNVNKRKKLGEASWYTGRTGLVGWLALNNKKRKFHKHVLVTDFFNHALPLRNTRLTSILSINSSH